MLQITSFMKHNEILKLALLSLALLLSSGMFAQPNCDPFGDGNPDLPGQDGGQGQGFGGSNNDATLSWQAILDQDCSGGTPVHLLTGALGTLSGAASPSKDYDPSDLCNHSSNLIPPAGDQSLKIAIIDSGVRPTSPGLFNQAPLISRKVESDGTISYGGSYPNPHGTFSAGVISGMLESQGVFTYEIHDYQVLNENLRTSLTAVVATIDDIVDQGDIKLVALSIGFAPFPCDNVDWENPSSPLYAALLRAEAAGVVVITSAGNKGNDLGVSPQYPAAYNDLSNVVSVGALACEGEVPASFSNYGREHVDLFTTGDFVKVLYGGCQYEITGTSFATSIVTAKAALHFTNTGNAETVLCNLRSQAKRFSATQYAIYGIVDVNERLAVTECSRIRSSGGVNFEKRLSSGNTTTTSVSPNPFQDEVLVTLEELDGLSTLTLFDAQGRQVLTRQVKTSQVTLPLQELAPGAYWLRIQDANGSETRTIIKQ